MTTMIDLEMLNKCIFEVENVFKDNFLNETEVDLVLKEVITKRQRMKMTQKMTDELGNKIPGWSKISKMLGGKKEDENGS